MEVDHHLIKENLDRNFIQFSVVLSEDQLANVLMKVVSGRVFNSSIDKLSMIDIYAPG